MPNQLPLFSKVATLVRHYWIGSVALLLITLVLFRSIPAWAAPVTKPVNQTVPQPTATKENTPVPQATNTPKPKKDKNDNKDQPTATSAAQQPAPTTAPQQPPPGDGPTGAVIADRLNVRQGPGTTFAIVGHVAKGDVVRIQQRNAAGDWWQVCCAGDTKSVGWVSSKFIQPNFDAAQTNTLIPVGDGSTAPAAAPTEAPTALPATQVVTPTTTAAVAATAVVTDSAAAPVNTGSTVTETTSSTSPLALTLEQTPTLVWQGQPVALHFVISNTGSSQATTVELRDELPQDLSFVSAEAGGDGKVVPQADVAGKHVVDVQWPQLAAGEAVTATVMLQLAPKLADGTVIDNLAVAAADQMGSVTAGISIGLPPASLPDFQ